MNAQTINENPYHQGGKHGPGQELYYALHRFRLWKWYCKVTNTPFQCNDTSITFKKKKEVLQGVCQSLGLEIDGTNKALIARLDRYEFTSNQLDILKM
jgi:hypothetical protein